MINGKMPKEEWGNRAFRCGYDDARAGREPVTLTVKYRAAYLRGYELGEQHKLIALLAKLNTDVKAT